MWPQRGWADWLTDWILFHGRLASLFCFFSFLTDWFRGEYLLYLLERYRWEDNKSMGCSHMHRKHMSEHAAHFPELILKILYEQRDAAFAHSLTFLLLRVRGSSQWAVCVPVEDQSRCTSDTFTLRGKPHNHQNQKYKEMFMKTMLFSCFNLWLKQRLSAIWSLCSSCLLGCFVASSEFLKCHFFINLYF